MTIRDPLKSQETQESHQGNPWLNIGKIIFLVASLAASWFLLEWLMQSK